MSKNKQDDIKKKITVITVVFNDEKKIEKTIKSVLAQRYQPLEFIVIDGKSTDGTLKIIKKYDQRIATWLSEKDQGIYDAMNKGAKLATGEVLYFLNSGDFFLDDKIVSEIMKRFNSSQKNELAMLNGNILYFDPISETKTEIKRQLSLKDLRKGVMASHQSVFMTKKVFWELSGFNLKYQLNADFEMFCKFFKKGKKYQYLDQTIAFYDGGGVSANQKINLKEKRLIIKKEFGRWHYGRFFIKSTVIMMGSFLLKHRYFKKIYHQLKYKHGLNIFKA